MKNTNNSPQELAEQLQTIQDSLSMSPAHLAQVLGVSLVTIDRWARGVGQPSIEQSKHIKDLLSSANRRPTDVSKAFLSKGATRRALKTSQMNLFLKTPKVCRLSTPNPPILKRLRNGDVIGSPESLQSVLLSNLQPAQTPAKPVATGASAGKNTYTYDAHTYHTKVPPQGIVEFLNHYLPDGGLVLDPFAGSGMTGVATRISGHDVILNELSPAACFIAHNFTEIVDPDLFVGALNEIMDSLADLRQWLYSTDCRECGRPVEASYFVWSYRVNCYCCDAEFILWDHSRKYGRTVREHKILAAFHCPICGELLQKKKLPRTYAEPVIVGYKCCRNEIREHPPSDADIGRIAEIEAEAPFATGYIPTTELPDGVNLNQPKRHGLTSIDSFYTTRNLAALSQIWRAIHCIDDIEVASAMAFVFTSLYQRVSRLSEYRFWGGSGNMARFNVPFIFNEANVFMTFRRKAENILDHIETTATQYTAKKAVVCGSATEMSCIPDESVDFVFTDPPFGANINYSEMNILWESWLGEFTDPSDEAIINRVQGKGIDEYGELMQRSLTECHRVLRKEHWMLLIFMNSSAKVWEELKRAIRAAGFTLERADIFDKQHSTFKQFVSPNTAGCDLVIHCKKTRDIVETTHQPPSLSLNESIRDFLQDYRGRVPTTVYLHVSRSEEIDYKFLYSEWMSYALVRDHELSDFSTFREIAFEVLECRDSDSP